MTEVSRKGLINSKAKRARWNLNGRYIYLTAKQAAFIRYYLDLGNARKAGLLAGYHQPSAGLMLLVHPDIKAILEHELSVLAEKFRPTKEKVLRKLGELIDADPADLFDKNGKIRPIHEIPPETRAAITSVTVSKIHHEDGTDETITKVKLESKRGSVDMGLKHLGMYQEQPQINVSVKMTAAEAFGLLTEMISRHPGLVKLPSQQVIDMPVSVKNDNENPNDSPF